MSRQVNREATSQGSAASERLRAVDPSTADVAGPAESVRDSDLALLRAYEPVVRYTKGELFLPTAVGPYVAQCSLWTGVRGGDTTIVVGGRVAAIERELGELDATIESERGLRAQARSLSAQGYARAAARSRQAEIAEREVALNQTIAMRTSLAEERGAHLATLSGTIAPEPPHAHIRRPHQPYIEAQQRRTRFLKLWAAVSTHYCSARSSWCSSPPRSPGSRRSLSSPPRLPGWRRLPAGGYSRSLPACSCWPARSL
jgi:hypothetical protein